MLAAIVQILGLALAVGPASAADSSFAVARMALHQVEDGALLPDSYEFLPGETAYFSCRLSGYQGEKSAEEQRLVKISWQAGVFDPAGVLLEKTKDGRIEGRLSPEDKEWIPKFLMSFSIPPFAPSGKYRIAVQARDELAGSETQSEFTFQVRAREVESSETLVARNFRFLSGEDDTVGTRTGVYHPGGTVWARFDLTGYKFGPNNHYSIACGMAVENADGKQLFAQPDAASPSGESFYPQRYVPITLNVTLDQKVRPATYTLVLTLRDDTGNQTWELRQPFLVQ